LDNVNLIDSLFDNVLHSLISVFGTDEMLRFLLEKDYSDWQYGSTYIASFTNFIPRGVWEDKPLGAGPLLTNFISPGAYELGRSNISSYTTGLMSEIYMNFGYIGIIIVAPLQAFLAVLIDRIKLKGFYSLCLRSYLLVLFGFAVCYSEFLGLLARALYVSIPVIISMFIKERIKVSI
jgi:hypothetical protein